MKKAPWSTVPRGVQLDSRDMRSNAGREGIPGEAGARLRRVHRCRKEMFAPHPAGNRAFGGMLSTFALSYYDYGRRAWFCFFKPGSGEEGHIHFLLRISFP